MSSVRRICAKCLGTSNEEVEYCPTDDRPMIAVDANFEDAGRTIDDKLTLIGKLGAGGMGTVYRAIQHSMQREVAVKVLKTELAKDDTLVRRFLQEATEANRLTHPNVITLFDFGHANTGELYIMMELLEGRTLTDVVKRGPAPPGWCIDIVCQVCDAIASAHDMGIIHRDLKPDNIFLCQGSGIGEEFVKVLDFGVAKILSDKDQNTVTATGQVCGSPAYMSPEQVQAHPMDGRSDLYSLGVVLYEMLTGQRPIEGDSPTAVMMAHIMNEPASVRTRCPELNLPTELDLVVMRMLAKSPEDRPRSAALLKKQLKRARSALTTEPSSVSVVAMETSAGMPSVVVPATTVPLQPTFVQKLPKKQNWGWIAGLACAALLVVGAVQIWGDKTADNADTLPPMERSDSTQPSTTMAAENTQPTSKPQPKPAQLPAPTMPKAVTAQDKAPAAVDDKNKAQMAPAPEPQDKTKPAPVQTTTVVSKPVGATVRINGQAVGKTPYTMDRPTGDKSVEIELRLKGYRTLRKTITSDAQDSVEMSLKKRKARSARTPKGSTTNQPKFVQ